MKPHSIRQDLQDYQDFLGLFQQSLVYPVDPVKKGNSNAIKFIFRSNWTLAVRGGAHMKLREVNQRTAGQ